VFEAFHQRALERVVELFLAPRLHEGGRVGRDVRDAFGQRRDVEDRAVEIEDEATMDVQDELLRP
jgi:hypothetical protein